jgi:hypothetical protein
LLVALSKAKKKALTDAGMDKAALAKLEAILDADDGDADNGSKPGSKPGGSKRVVVYEGEDAEEFMRGLFKGSDDEGSDDADDESEDEDEAEGDDAPAKGPRWFK